MRRSGGLLARLPGAGRQSAAAEALELHIDCDDIQMIWDRFPALAPGDTGEALPAGLLIVREHHLKNMAANLAEPAQLIADGLREPLDALAAAWRARGQAPDWAAVADALIGGIGLGVAVPRLLSWRAPAAFARESGHSGGARPFLQLCFLPGSGAAGLALLDATASGPVDRVVARAAGNDWAQTWRSYESGDRELTAYGQAGQALLAAGVLRRRGVSLQARSELAVPVLTLADFAAVRQHWHKVIETATAAVDSHREALWAAVEGAWPDSELIRAEGRGAQSARCKQDQAADTAPLACDYLDACYFALADLIFTRISKELHATVHPQPRPAKISAVVVDEPGAVWRWLTNG